MQKHRYSEEGKAAIVREVQAGVKVVRVCCEHDISIGTYYKWRKQLQNKNASPLQQTPEEAKAIREQLNKKHDAHKCGDMGSVQSASVH